MNALPDNHSIEFEFDDLEIEIEGLFCSSFYGKAELALNDPRDGDFYVKGIVLRGRRRERTHRPYGYSPLYRWKNSVERLDKPAADDRTFKAHLFRKLEAAIYEDEVAKAAWASELEDAA